MGKIKLKHKSFAYFILITIFIVFLLPLAVVTLAANEAGMLFTIILFFVVNPVFVICMGVFSGKSMKKRWYMPVILPVLFVISSWTMFSMGEPAFIMYAGVYLILGLAAMGFEYWLIKK